MTLLPDRLSRPRRRGFTLLELMVSLALMGLVIIGLYSFIFAMTEIWGQGREW